MKIEQSINPNCSEAVFRFYTTEPQKMHSILQAIADEVSATDPNWGQQKIPLLPNAKDYEIPYRRFTDKDWKEHFENQKQISEWRDKGMITVAEADRRMSDLEEKKQKKMYPKGSKLFAVAGLGDNEAVIKVDLKKESFRLNIGNNSISENKTGWTEKIRDLGVRANYADDGTKEGKNLGKFARDCTCGISYDLDLA